MNSSSAFSFYSFIRHMARLCSASKTESYDEDDWLLFDDAQLGDVLTNLQCLASIATKHEETLREKSVNYTHCDVIEWAQHQTDDELQQQIQNALGEEEKQMVKHSAKKRKCDPVLDLVPKHSDSHHQTLSLWRSSLLLQHPLCTPYEPHVLL